jgi:hypothetical protein
MIAISVDSIAEFVGTAAAPLVDQLATDAGVIGFVAELGWDLPSAPPVFTDIHDSAQALVEQLGTLTKARLMATDPNDSSIGSAAAAVTGAMVALIAEIEGLPNALQSQLPPTFLTESGIAGAIKGRLLDFLIIEALSSSSRAGRAVLVVLGIIEETDLDVDPTTHQSEFTLREFRLDRLKTFLTSPRDAMADVYGWGTPQINVQRLVTSLNQLSLGLMSPAEIAYPSAALVASMFGGLPAGTMMPTLVNIPIGSLDAVAFEVAVFPAPTATATEAQGLAFRLIGVPQGSISFGIGRGLTLVLTVTAALDTGIGLVLKPALDPDLKVGIEGSGNPLLSGGINLALTRDDIDSPIHVFDLGGGGGLDLQGYHITLDLTAAPIDVSISAGVDGGKFSFSLADADGFIKGVVPSSKVTLDFNLGIGWSTSRGFFLTGSAGLETTVPINATFGPISISKLTLAIQVSGDGILIGAGADLGVSLGPVQATIQGIGAAPQLAFKSGNMGPMDFELGFKAPTGLGLSIDAGSVHGGGFISFESTAGRYSGALQLSIYDIAVSAFGLVDTKVPGVSYSFVLIISAQFTPIQLGFGFTLNGVGGMVGINRAIDTTALANLVRAGQSEDLLFPQNVVADAPTIVRDLTSVFPATQGHYVFGPLGKLGWGTPTIITGEIGVILEIPGPVVAILGEVKCVLPKPEAPLVKLNVSVDGELDFPNKSFSMDATLHDSVINGYPVSGQMAMRVSWGDQPNFIFSIGGFHPAYTPPPDFPKLQPLAIDLASHGPAKLTVSGFFAVTPNTVQVGGTASLHASGSGISMDASVSVKALFVFSPFAFEADIDASVKISFHGYGPSVHLSGVLDGPSPWHVKGEVCVSIIWWDACLGFDVTFGGNQQVTQPSIDPWLGAAAIDSTPAVFGLHDALSDPGNWSGALVPGTVSSVTRAQGTDTLIDPVGGLTVRQKTAPVERPNPLTKFGVAKVPAPISFSGVQATLGSPGNTVALTAVEKVNEFFAPAQFFDMDDGKKLSSAAFESYQAGYLFATANGNVHGGTSVTSQPQLQTIVINSDGSDTVVDTPFTPTDNAVSAANTRSAVAKGGLTQAGTRRFINRLFTQPFTEQVSTFVIATSATLIKADQTPDAAVRSATLIALDTYRAQNIDNAAAVEVAASFELPPSG